MRSEILNGVLIRFDERDNVQDVLSQCTTIGKQAFLGVKTFSKIVIPENVTQIQSGAFKLCSKLQSVKILGDVKELPDYVFAGCTNLKEAVLPKKLEAIKGHAFSHCKKMEYIKIPKTVAIIDSKAFIYCESLQGMEFEEGSVYDKSQACLPLSALFEKLGERKVKSSLTNEEKRYANLKAGVYRDSKMLQRLDERYQKAKMRVEAGDDSEQKLKKLKDEYEARRRRFEGLINEKEIDEAELIEKIANKDSNNNFGK